MRISTTPALVFVLRTRFVCPSRVKTSFVETLDVSAFVFDVANTRMMPVSAANTDAQDRINTIKALMAYRSNIAHHWRRARGVPYVNGAESRRPVHVPGCSLGVRRLVFMPKPAGQPKDHNGNSQHNRKQRKPEGVDLPWGRVIHIPVLWVHERRNKIEDAQTVSAQVHDA